MPSLIIAVDKAANVTSHDVVNTVRREYGVKRVGHTGTLDPFATGLLLICIGSATRLSDFILAKDKTYEATISFGTSTDTLDSEGAVVERGELKSELADASFAREVLSGFLGKSMQIPPAYSAIKIKGQKSYDLARSGKLVEHASRPIEIFEIELVSIKDNEWNIRTKVSKGTYIRALGRDIGAAAGVPAHLNKLRRTAIGSLSSPQQPTPVLSSPRQNCEAILGEGANAPERNAGDLAIDTQSQVNPLTAIDLPWLEIDNATQKFVRDGRPINLESNAIQIALVYNQELIAIYEKGSNNYKPKVVLSEGVLIPDELCKASHNKESEG